MRTMLSWRRAVRFPRVIDRTAITHRTGPQISVTDGKAW